MPDVRLIVGLCGCGKYHRAKELQENGYVVLDETYPFEPEKRFAADDGRHLSTEKFNELVKQLKEGKKCAFTEAM